MSITFTDDQLNAIIAKSVIESLTPERRGELIAQAIQNLLTKDGSHYGDKRSPFQRAFDHAVESVARDVAREKLANDPEVRAKVTQLFSDAWMRVTQRDEAYSSLIDRLADGIRRGLSE